MKLAPSIKFDKNKLEFIGFTDIGKYTLEEQKDKPGDHALVILYQPFQGSWIQAIGAFLSLNAASGHVLSQIILEAVVSVENSVFFVDCVTTDGASWNRNMWQRFGVTEEKPYCQHMMDDERRLYFVSDFCHLIKNLWQWIVNKRFIVASFISSALYNICALIFRMLILFHVIIDS